MALNNALKRLSPWRPWFRVVNTDTLKADVVAGLTNAAIVLPQGVAFAIIAGLPPEFGLFTAIVVTMIAALWGASMVMVSGPTTAISAVVFVTLSSLAEPGSQHYIALALTLTFLVGLLQLTAGLAGLGALIAFVSHSVIVGFTAAAALLIAVSQLPGLLGLPGSAGGGALDRIADVIPNLFGLNPVALGISAITLFVLLVAVRIDKRIPAYLLALIAGSIAASFLDAKANGIALFSPLGSVVPTFGVPNLTLADLGALLPGTFAVAFVGLLEAISIGKSFAFRRGERYDSNQEIVGQGLSNLVGSFFQSYAGSGSFTRSGLNAESGARTPMAAIFAAILLAGSLLIIAPLVPYVPVPAIATIILYVAWRLIGFAEIRHILTTSRSETLILLGTFVTGVVSELDFAILVGVLISLCVFLSRSAYPSVNTGAPMMLNGRRVFRNADEFDLPLCPQITNMRIEGPVFFASIEHVEREFRRFEEAGRSATTRVLSLKGAGSVDMSGADFLINETRAARALGKDMHLIVAHKSSVETLRRFHVVDVLGSDNIHSNKSEAIAAAVAAADDEICRNCRARIFHECAAKPGSNTP